jgi:hypothetical protein
MKRTLIRATFGAAVLLAPFITGCATEDAPQFWRLSRAGEDTVMYMMSGHAYLIVGGRVYEYEPPSSANHADQDFEYGPTARGAWREVEVASIPSPEPRPVARAQPPEE